MLFAAAVFGGIFVGLPATFVLIGQLSIAALYATFGAITGVPVAGVLWRELGWARALVLAAATAVVMGLLMFALGQGACAASSCAR